MKKNSWVMISFLVVMGVWTLFAWGVYEILYVLPQLFSSASQSEMAQLIPQTLDQTMNPLLKSWVELWSPAILPIWQSISDVFPSLLSWLGYIVWFIWGAVSIVLLVIAALVRKVLP